MRWQPEAEEVWTQGQQKAADVAMISLCTFLFGDCIYYCCILYSRIIFMVVFSLGLPSVNIFFIQYLLIILTIFFLSNKLSKTT